MGNDGEMQYRGSQSRRLWRDYGGIMPWIMAWIMGFKKAPAFAAKPKMSSERPGKVRG